MIAIEMRDELFREAYFEKFLALKSIFIKEIPELIYDANHRLDNGKIISVIYVQKDNVSIHNKQTWGGIYAFFNEKMNKIETLFISFEYFIKDI